MVYHITPSGVPVGESIPWPTRQTSRAHHNVPIIESLSLSHSSLHKLVSYLSRYVLYMFALWRNGFRTFSEIEYWTTLYIYIYTRATKNKKKKNGEGSLRHEYSRALILKPKPTVLSSRCSIYNAFHRGYWLVQASHGLLRYPRTYWDLFITPGNN